MTRIDYIGRCKYYKSEGMCPYAKTDERMYFWNAEKLYVETIMASPEGMMEYMEKHVRNEEVEALCLENDGVDTTVTSFLFTYYETFVGDYHTMDEIVAGFKRWYEQYRMMSK